jgi:O-antigen/teichoic acid export membrane protein
VRDLLPRGDGRPPPSRTGASWFLGIAAAAFLAQTFDNLIVGYSTDVTALGQYALAFSLAFAPLSQVSWEIGGVLFPAIAATRDPELVGRRTLKALRLMALLLLPLAPVAIVLAPAIVPELLGEEWEGMVLPFQLLILAGVGQGVLNVLAEVMAASGGVASRARIDLSWAAVTMVAVAVGAQSIGIEGAAIAHVGCFVLLAVAYGLRGAHVLGLRPVELLRALGRVGAVVAVQGFVTAAVAVELAELGASGVVAGVAGALLGLLALGAALPLLAPGPLAEMREALGAARHRRGPAPVEAAGA